MTRHGKLLTSTGGLIILPEEEFNKVRCKPRPMRARTGDSAGAGDVGDEASGPSRVLRESPSGAALVEGVGVGKTKASKAAKVADVDGSGNFEQQRQEDLIRLLYQRLTSPNEHSSAESSGGESSRSSSPAPVLMRSDIGYSHIEQVVVDSPEVAAAVVVESIPSSQDQV